MAGKQITVAEKRAAAALFTSAATQQVDLLKRMKISEEAFSRVLVNALMRNPGLARCTKESIYTAVYSAVELAIVPDGRHGAIVPVKKNNVLTADFWPMIAGLATLVRRHIPNIAVQAHLVFEGDEFEDIRGTSPQLVHIPNRNVDRESESAVVCAYATAHFPTNPVAEFEVMYLPELKKFRKQNRGPWSTHPLEMYRVRPFKRLLKRLPVSGGLAAMLGRYDDEQADVPAGDDSWLEGEAERVEDPPPPPPPPQSDPDPLALDPADVGGQTQDPGAGYAGDGQPIDDMF